MEIKLEQSEVVLEQTRQLSSSTGEFRFVRVDGKNVEFRPGQFFRFVFKDNQGEFERSYSLCNQVMDVPYLDLLISKVESGRATELLFASEQGLTAHVTGPYGRLLVPEPLPKRLFMVATSVGIAPYIPMLTRLSPALKSKQVEVHFLYGTREHNEFVFGDVLEKYSEDHPDFHLSVCYSRVMPDEAREFEYQGYVQARLKNLDPDPKTDRVLLCGNPHMVDETYDWLKETGFGVKHVTREKYVFAKETQSKSRTSLTDEHKKLIAEKMKKYQS
tara:strand:- start:85 stop:906 length:822 start_codon:yes stop_codon:yes gene_type:complete